MSPVHPISVNSENGTFYSISSKMQSNSNKTNSNHTNSNNTSTNHSGYYNNKAGEGVLCESELYLNRLVNFETILGVTFFGRQFHHYSNACLRPFLVLSLIFYDLLCVSAMLYLEFYAFNQFVYSRLFRHSSSKLTMSIIFRSTGYCIFIEYLCIKLLTLFKGPPLIRSVVELGRNVRFNRYCLTQYYIIYVVILTEVTIHSASFVLMFKPMIDQNSSDDQRCLLIAYYAVVGVIYGANKSCICSLHMLASILICKRISDNKANLRSCPNFGVMLEDMLQLKIQLENFNDLLSVTLLIKVIVNSILLCSCVCAIDDLAKDQVVQWDRIIALSLLFLSQLFDETISCVASQRIANEMGSLIRAIQQLTAQQCTEFLHLTANPRPPSSSSLLLSSTNNVLSGQCRAVEDVEYRCLQHICSMRDSFLYNVLNLFDLRSVTILAILSNVCNYSTILIQTTET